MSHPFGDLISQHLHRKHGLNQSRLAAGIDQPHVVISLMCQGKRLTGPQARERVLAIIRWLRQMETLTTHAEADALLNAAGMAGLNLTRPEEARLAQLLQDSPATRSSGSAVSLRPDPVQAAGNLPLPITSFIGREHELAEIESFLSQDQAPAPIRLLTLTGAGGCGKSRLALQVASEIQGRFLDGAWLVRLASTLDPALIPYLTANALSLHEEPGQSIGETLLAYLKTKRLLLILDNCEHLIEPSARFAELILSSCPQVWILATSREALGIGGEQTLPVLPLKLPPALNAAQLQAEPTAGRLPADLLHYDAVQLFVERARAVQPRFTLTHQNAQTVVQLCRQLDGIPLALELAAARMKALTVEQIAARLDDRFRLLTGGSRTTLPRQQTLRALIDWSYDLLPETERIIFRRLSVFAGGWSLEAAEAVCSDASVIIASEMLDGLTQLVSKSLVVMDDENGVARYRMLETIRQYAYEKLCEAGEDESVLDRHMSYFVDFMEEEESISQGAEQLAWFDRLAREQENLRSALAWALANDPEIGLRMARSLWWFWYLHETIEERHTWLEGTLARSRGTTPAVRVKAMIGTGVTAYFLSDLAHAWGLLKEGLKLAEETGNEKLQAVSLYYLGRMAQNAAEYTQATGYYTRCLTLFAGLDDIKAVANCLDHLGSLAVQQANPERAAVLWGSAAAVRERSAISVSPVDRSDLARNIRLARSKLPEDGWQAAWAEGTGMDLASAIAYATR